MCNLSVVAAGFQIGGITLADILDLPQPADSLSPLQGSDASCTESLSEIQVVQAPADGRELPSYEL